MRPLLDKNLKADIFNAYYWLKEELATFCRENKLPCTGNKKDLTKRISTYLETGQAAPEAVKPSINAYNGKEEISLQEIIPKGYKNDERHRAFFKTEIGEHFKFNVSFMNWMKQNAGQTYQKAVQEWLQIEQDKKAGKKYEISPQFEYNQYTRDFFASNPSESKEHMIKCWRYKKGLPGTNKYEESDLEF